MAQARDEHGRFVKALEDVAEPEAVEEYLASDEMTRALLAAAEEAAEYWKSIAPVESGAYRDSIEVKRYGDDVYVVASDFKAGWIEFGTEDTPEFACRARTEAYFNDR